MTELEAYRNTFAAIQGLRSFRQGEPKEIALIDRDSTWLLIGAGGWSKTSINGAAEIVFLILSDLVTVEQIEEAKTIRFGDQIWEVTGRKSPDQTEKPYWQLSVNLQGVENA